MNAIRTFRSIGVAALFVSSALAGATAFAGGSGSNVGTGQVRMAEDGVNAQRTSKFEGAKANAGFATLAYKNGHAELTLSDDFVVPNTPAPHWQLVDSAGNTYLLNRLVIKGDKYNKTLAAPGYIKDVAKVQIWCAYAEVLLGEASFTAPVPAHTGMSMR